MSKLPDGWKLVKLNNISTIKSGATPLRAKQEKYYSLDGTPWIKTLDLNNSYIFDTQEKITEIALKETSCSVFPIKTVLVAMYGGFNQIGRTGLITEPSATNQAISGVVLDPSKAYPEYILNFLNANVKKWKKFAASSRKDPNITRRDICNFSVLLPPLPEQTKIAQILSKWDNAINTTEQLLANSQQQKKALMQQLLTGKKRLQDENGEVFCGEWVHTKLDDLGSYFSGLSGKTKDDFGKGKNYIPYLNIFRNSAIDSSFMDKVEINDTEKQNEVKYGDIFFTTSSETIIEVGMSSVLLEELENTYLNSFCFGFRLNDFNELLPEFASHLLRGEVVRRKISILGQGATRYNLSKKALMTLILELPPLPEQQAVAKVLTTADQQIDSLQQQIVRLKDEKKGLMQVLLSGKVRVKGENL